MSHHLIFEGPELVGKSWLMSQIYDVLEKKYNQSKTVLDGCHWINADIGIFGTANGERSIDNYIELLKTLKDSNVIVEKFHITDMIYSALYRRQEINYDKVEKQLNKLDVKLISCTMQATPQLIKDRLNDRLNLYPHYKRMAQSVDFYIDTTKRYQLAVEQSKLPSITVDLTQLPNQAAVDQILDWIGEK